MPAADSIPGKQNNGRPFRPDSTNDSSSSSSSDTSLAEPVAWVPPPNPNRRKMLIAHGVLAAFAFAILFPLGGITIRLSRFPGAIYLHAIFQILAYIIYIAAFGLGVTVATQLRLLSHHHAIIGMLVLALVSVQPVTGVLHHLGFKKRGGRTGWSYAHVWVGRGAVTLGIVNGGLGLRLAWQRGFTTRWGLVVYGVVAGVMLVVWVAAMVVGERKRAREITGKEVDTPRSGSGTAVETQRMPVEGYYGGEGQKTSEVRRSNV